MSTLAVVEEILRETETPMSVRQIVEYANGRLPTRSKTPDTVVARDLSMDIKKKGAASLFIRTEPGRFTLREIYLRNQARLQQVEQTATEDVSPERPERIAAERTATMPTPLASSAMRTERVGTLAARPQTDSDEHTAHGHGR